MKKQTRKIDIKQFGERMKHARKAQRMKQATLAEMIQVHQNSISHYEHGTSAPSLDTAYIIAKELNVSLDYLVGLKEENSPIIESVTINIDKQFLNNISSFINSLKGEN